ncbi:hypothetical protein DFH07DRAFT_1066448 [Mycena maculata]|uniref:Uncharacterized protein n=1 Tax=Mycena maculata TaxID=230809 RepID=A0AAD7MR16_9AGAR|nr:hypothetical protein DFH07DRAFT_1066448 [Mycena maculata]
MLFTLSSIVFLLGAPLIGANTLSKRISYAYSIADFQGHMIDLSDGKAQLFTPVQSFAPANTTNQQGSPIWALLYSQDARELYEVANVKSGIMSHTTALLKPPGPAIHAQIKEPGAIRLLHRNGLALTAWPAGGNKNYPSSPLTLEDEDPKNKRQVFHLTCLRGWSMPAEC